MFIPCPQPVPPCVPGSREPVPGTAAGFVWVLGYFSLVMELRHGNIPRSLLLGSGAQEPALGVLETLGQGGPGAACPRGQRGEGAARDRSTESPHCHPRGRRAGGRLRSKIQPKGRFLGTRGNPGEPAERGRRGERAVPPQGSASSPGEMQARAFPERLGAAPGGPAGPRPSRGSAAAAAGARLARAREPAGARLARAGNRRERARGHGQRPPVHAHRSARCGGVAERAGPRPWRRVFLPELPWCPARRVDFKSYGQWEAAARGNGPGAAFEPRLPRPELSRAELS